MDNNGLYRRAFLAYGAAAQIRKVQEECGELIVAAAKLLTHPGKKETVAQLLEEAADVKIMIEQIGFMFGTEEIDAIVKRKLERLDARIGNEGKVPAYVGNVKC